MKIILCIREKMNFSAKNFLVKNDFIFFLKNIKFI